MKSAMTKLMEKAIDRLRALPTDKQDSFAGFLLAELESDTTWDRLLSQRSSELERLADQALDDYRNGTTEILNPDAL